MTTGMSRLSPMSCSIALRNVRRSLLTSGRPFTTKTPAWEIAISRVSPRGVGAACSVASGSLMLISASRTKVVETMKKMTSSNTTSISDVRLISGSSLAGRCSFMLCGSKLCRSLAVGQHGFEELHSFLLHLHHEPVDAAAQLAGADQRRDRVHQPCRRGDERFAGARRDRRRGA